MTREKCETRSNYKNIGEIGKENIDKNSNIVGYTFDWVIQNYEEYKQQLLQNLIKKYGEEEGKRQFDIIQHASVVHRRSNIIGCHEASTQ